MIPVTPDINEITVFSKGELGMLWKAGDILEVLVDENSRVIQIQDRYWDCTPGDRYEIIKKGSESYIKSMLNSSANLVKLEQSLLDAGAGDYIILRNGKWYYFCYAKGPGGSGVPWVFKKLPKRSN